MYCWHCGKPIPEEAGFCAACGMIVVGPAEGTGGAASAEQEVHSLLTQANLLRMRKDWQGAILRCTEALKISPASASAHSLLGDICRDEGRPRDAIEWYKLALTLDPARRQDREKLDALIDQVYGAGKPGSQVEASVEIAGVRETTLKSGLWVGGMALAGSFLVTLSAFLLYYLSLPRQVFPPLPPRRIRQSAPSVQKTEKVAETAPPTESAAGIQGESPPPATAPIPGADEKAPENLAEREGRLSELLSEEAQQAGAGVVVLGAEIDPRKRAAEISFSLPQEETFWQTKQRILELALRFGKAAAEQEPSLGTVVARAYVEAQPPPDTGPEISFIGDASAERLRAANPEELTAKQTEGIFYNKWWHHLLAEVEPPVSAGE